MDGGVHLFVAYRGANEALRDKLLAAIEFLRGSPWGRDHPFSIWSDNQLLGVPEWEAEIATHIDHADLFLLLITTDTDRGYALEVELQRAIKRAREGKIRIIPVVCDDIIGFLNKYGIDDFALNRIPKRGLGLSSPPYNADWQAWLDDVIVGVKKSVERVYVDGQLSAPAVGDVAARCADTARRALDVARADTALGASLPAIEFAAQAVLDLLAAGGVRILDLAGPIERRLAEGRRTARDLGATATEQVFKDLGAEFIDLKDVAREEGYSARVDKGERPSVRIDAALSDASADVSKLNKALDRVEAVAADLTKQARTAPAAQKVLLTEVALRLGADSRLARAASENPYIETEAISVAGELLADTIESVAAVPTEGFSARTRALIAAAGRAVASAVRYVARLVARAFDRPVPPELPPDPPAQPRLAWPPTIVKLPRGRFRMGRSLSKPGSKAETPAHWVSIDYDLALGRTPVTFVEWDAARASGANLPYPPDEGWGRDDRPVINVSWNDAHAYIGWLNDRLGLTGRLDRYRLPSEAEWEYGCRARTATPFSFGETITTDQANFDGNYAYGSAKPSNVNRKKTTPAGQFPANAFGLHDMHGNVWEWCEDAWHESYDGAPTDGSVWQGGDPSSRVVRGGSWLNIPLYLRSPFRSGSDATGRNYALGFRLARTLSPPSS